VDNNNPMQPVGPTTPIAQPTPQVSPPPVIPSGGDKRMVLWFVIGLVIIIVVVGGIYMYLSRQQSTGSVQQTPAPQAAQENLENELNAIEVANPEQEFTSVDQDLKTL